MARTITKENNTAKANQKDHDHPMLLTLRPKQDISTLSDEGLLINTRVKAKEHTDRPEKVKATTDGIIATVSYA